jgi:oxygen-independent coproporphyrinogen-3 oxidase
MKVTRNQEIIRRYLSSLYKEIALTSENINSNRKVTQIHFGGGTPNFLTPQQILEIGELLKSKFLFSDRAEISCEVDPRTFSKEQLTALQSMGVNRISLGVQDFNPQVQKKINRINSYNMVEKIVSMLRSSGIEAINFDLIYGLPGQTVDSFDTTLDKIISLNPSRLAIYNFAYIPWVKPHQKLIRENELPSPETKFTLLQLMIEKLTNCGYEYIGMDHFAKENDDLTLAQSQGTLYRNFQGYSTQKDTDLFGFGLTSISQFGDAYFQNHKEFRSYYQSLDNDELPLSKGLVMTESDKQVYTIIMSLMCNMELNYESISKQIGIDFEHIYSRELAEIKKDFSLDGLVTFTDDGMKITNSGRLYIRNIAMKFDKYLTIDNSLYSKTV